jgi:hypothetical protein
VVAATPPPPGLGVSIGGPLPPPPSTALSFQVVTKLTATEYANTVSDLLGVAPAQQTVPLGADGSAGGFSVGGASTDQTASAYHDSAVQIAGVATAAGALPVLLAPAGCTPPVNDDAAAGAACASAFIVGFSELAFRHGAVDPTTVAGLEALYTKVAALSGFTAGIAAVVEEVLQSPFFLYHLETEQEALGPTPQPIAVTGYSMANRLSYFLWGSMPDAVLRGAADAGTLSTPAQVLAQATRMAADPKAKIGVANFSRQWLTEPFFPDSKLGNSTQIAADGTLSPTPLWSNEVATGESFEAVFSPAAGAMIRSFEMQVQDALWAPSDAMRRLLTGTTAYANAALAPMLGVNVTGDTLQPVELDRTKRIGILSHPLLMAMYATNATSHPIKRGRFILGQILCQPPPNPPAGVPAFTPPRAGTSLRQDFEQLTATGPYAGQPSADPSIPCAACHARIDPPGYLFEPFDTIGDFRTIDDYGQPVDLSNITIVRTGDPLVDKPTASSVELAQNLAASDLPNQCLTQMLYRFMARRDDAQADAASEAWIDEAFDLNHQSLVPALATTETDAFLARVNQNGGSGGPPADTGAGNGSVPLPPGTPVPTWSQLYTLYFGNPATGGCGSTQQICHQAATDTGATYYSYPSGGGALEVGSHFVCGQTAADCYQGLLRATPPLVTAGAHPADPSATPLVASLYKGGRAWNDGNNGPQTLGYVFAPSDLALIEAWIAAGAPDD